MDVWTNIAGNDFVWDADKAAKTLRDRGIRFEDAATVLMDPFFKIVDASRNSEVRDAAIGLDQTGRLLFVVHIEVDDSHIRIISARRAEAEEEKFYAE